MTTEKEKRVLLAAKMYGARERPRRLEDCRRGRRHAVDAALSAALQPRGMS